MKKLVMFFAVALLTVACKNENKNTEEPVEAQRIVSLSGTISEVLVNLGEEDNIVGVDVTTTYPASLTEKATNLGHVRSITIEPLLALQPTVIYASSKDVNPDLMKQIKEANITLHTINQEFSVEGTANLIKEVATSLNKENYQPMVDEINNKIEKVMPFETQPKVLFIYARGAGNMMVAGQNTPLDAVINLAGGVNAAQGFEDFKPLTPEALLEANPDVILMFESGLQSIGGVDGIMQIEGVAQTNAGKNKKVIAMDGQFLSGFSPRLGDAVLELNKQLR